MAHREPTVDTLALADWLKELSGTRPDPAVMCIRAPSGGGWSSDTLFVDTDARASGRVVLRLAPTGPAMFPSYDLSRQTTVMHALSRSARVRVPAVLGADLEGIRLGRAAFVMEYVRGRVPIDDRPSFAEAGFLFDASSEDQRRFHLGLLDSIVAVHTCLDPTLAARLTTSAGAGVASAVEELGSIWDFDRGDRYSPVIDDAFDRLRHDIPKAGDDVLLWGDARPANVIVPEDGFVPLALIDWELAAVGPAEFDVTWLAEMNRMRMEGSGVAPLPGFLTDDDAFAHYETRSGRALHDISWFQLFSSTRIAVLMHRHLRVMVHLGRLPADHRLLTRTVATERLAQLLTR